MKKELIGVYKKLLNHFGEQHWWPAETEFEVVVGAILTQAAAWQNVEIAIRNLKCEGILNTKGIRNISEERLAGLVRPAGYFNAKSRKLKSFINFLYDAYDGDFQSMVDQPKEKLREELLSVWGIGPETADSIVLYAAHKPSFVVDAYTRRIFHRMGMVDEKIDYDDLKEFFEKQLPEDLEIYKEFHALIVELGKNHCKPKPRCEGCPLNYACGNSMERLRK